MDRLLKSIFQLFYQSDEYKDGELDPQLLRHDGKVSNREKQGLPKRWADCPQVFFSHFYPKCSQFTVHKCCSSRKDKLWFLRNGGMEVWQG